MNHLDSAFVTLTGWLEAVLFYPVFGFPVLVAWMVAAGVFFTLYFRLPNITMLPHALTVASGRYDRADLPGEVSSRQSMIAAVSGTVGLGNIAGVAIAIAIGGPGAVIWMMIAAFFGMAAKFAEVTLGHKYRHFDKAGRVHGGPFYYLRDGVGERFPALGKGLAIMFAVFCLGGALGGGNMLQSNQSVTLLTDTYAVLSGWNWLLSALMAGLVGVVLIGGIRRIAHTAEAIVPLMAFIYIAACIAVLVVNASAIPAAFATMFHSAFTLESAGGGMVGAIIMGFRRAFFSNEAGIGSAPIAHAPARNAEPVREGAIALLEPLIDTIIICTMTGLVIVISGVYLTAPDTGFNGVLLTSAAFATVIEWFPQVLAISVLLFAFSTIITWAYYGEQAWYYLFGGTGLNGYYVVVMAATFFGGFTDRAKAVVDFSDLLILAMAIPNLIGVYLLTPVLKREVASYVARMKSGEFAN